ncbi:hypothetical protein TNCT_69221, partial [Trichonephila clavata]
MKLGHQRDQSPAAYSRE